MPRTGCGRWNSNDASDTAACRDFRQGGAAQDRFLRTVGFGRAARRHGIVCPLDARRDVEAYLAGVNAFIAAHHGRQLPPEFSLLRFAPEAVDRPRRAGVGQDDGLGSERELLVGAAQARSARRASARSGRRSCCRPIRDDGLNILNGRRATSAAPTPESPESARRFARPIAAAHRGRAHLPTRCPAVPVSVRDLLLGGARTEALGSNNWVVDGTLTASGKPLLANDPHLATHIPSLWYLAHLSGGDFEVIGATLPGAPAVAIGRNRYIAWGETNVAADVQDLYRERLNQAGDAAEFRGR